jgi:hypothetical protein
LDAIKPEREPPKYFFSLLSQRHRHEYLDFSHRIKRNIPGIHTINFPFLFQPSNMNGCPADTPTFFQTLIKNSYTFYGVAVNHDDKLEKYFGSRSKACLPAGRSVR